jgi:hypothetical protein
MVEKRSVYRSKVDARMMAVKSFGLGILLFAVYYMLRILPPTADVAAALMLLILITMGFVAAPLRYIITSTELVVQSGILKTRIALGEILRVHPSSTLAAARSLSMDQLAVEYQAGPHSRPTVHISPAHRDQFLQELAAAAGLELRDQQGVRPVSPSSGSRLRGQMGA